MLNIFGLPTLLSANSQLTEITTPIMKLLNDIFSAAIPLVGAIGAIYCIILGVKLAKAEEQQDREKAKSALKNAIVGFVLIFVLVVALRIALPIMSTWVDTSAPMS